MGHTAYPSAKVRKMQRVHNTSFGILPKDNQDKGGNKLSIGFASELEKGDGEVAVTSGILVEIILMVLLGSEEILQGEFFNGKGLAGRFLNVAVNLINHLDIRRIGIKDAGTVLRSFILALLVQAERIDGLEVQFQQQLKGDHIGIVLDLDRLGKAGVTSLDLLVRGVVQMTVSKAYFGLGNSPYLFEIMLSAPEAPARQIYFLYLSHNALSLFFTKILFPLE